MRTGAFLLMKKIPTQGLTYTIYNFTWPLRTADIIYQEIELGRDCSTNLYVSQFILHPCFFLLLLFNSICQTLCYSLEDFRQNWLREDHSQQERNREAEIRVPVGKKGNRRSSLSWQQLKQQPRDVWNIVHLKSTSSDPAAKRTGLEIMLFCLEWKAYDIVAKETKWHEEGDKFFS